MMSFVGAATIKAASILSSSRVIAADPGIGISFSGIPGIAQLRSIFGALGGVALMACVAALVIGAAFWAAGSISSNPQTQAGGKRAVLIALVAAFVIGGGSALVTWASDLGGEI